MEEMNLQQQVREVKLQIEKLEEKYIVEESITKETYKKFSAKYSDELKKLEKQTKEKKKVLDVKKTEFDKLLEILHNPYELYKKTETPDGKTRLLKLIFERIYVYDKKIQKVQYTASIKQLLDNQAVLFRSKWLPGNSFLRTIIHTRKGNISMVLKYTFARSWHEEVVSIKRELNTIEKV